MDFLEMRAYKTDKDWIDASEIKVFYNDRNFEYLYMSKKYHKPVKGLQSHQLSSDIC